MIQTTVQHRKNTKLKSRVETLIKELPAYAGDDFLKKLTQLREHCLENLASEADALLCMLFVNAIKEHYHPHERKTGHIYLEKFEIPQIQLFDILINKFPFVTSAHAISNRFITRWIGNASSAVVVDVGIGRGTQMVSLIQALTAKEKLRELTIIGIEPFADAISHAMNVIDLASKLVDFKITTSIIEGFAENTRTTELKKLLPSDYDRLVVNGSLSVHHIPSVTLRRQFFDKIKMLSPDGIVLTEPHTDHMTDDWKGRTANAWVHYGAIFNTIDQLDISDVEKNGLKIFFGREVTDVVAMADSSRFERHETAERWLTYGKNIGMQPDLPLQAPMDNTNVVTTYPREGCLMMKRGNVDVLAIIPLVNPANK